jgi:hypothetical protein
MLSIIKNIKYTTIPFTGIPIDVVTKIPYIFNNNSSIQPVNKPDVIYVSFIYSNWFIVNNKIREIEKIKEIGRLSSTIESKIIYNYKRDLTTFTDEYKQMIIYRSWINVNKNILQMVNTYDVINNFNYCNESFQYWNRINNSLIKPNFNNLENNINTFLDDISKI